MIADLHKDIGTAKDNHTSPVHDWYRFTAGFSYKLIDKIISEEKLGNKDVIYESFAGCGTTLVSAQKHGIMAMGNEGQRLLYDVIRAKLNWRVNTEEIPSFIEAIKSDLLNKKHKYSYHELLKSLYSENDLQELYVIKNHINQSTYSEETQLFLKLALTQTLHKTSIHPISVPYISRAKTITREISAINTFLAIVQKMQLDLNKVKKENNSSKIFLHDSRTVNIDIPESSCSICMTSPPYLNNLDYGEVSKVCSHFFGITNNWSDITEKVRKNLVTGATTHYKNSDFIIDKWKKKDFYSSNKDIVDKLFPSLQLIEFEGKKRKGRKSFHLLSLFYFEDMYKVLLEMRRVLKPNSRAYLVLGDSAPYGVFINTTRIIGEIAKNAGFNKYEIVKIRERGTKWKLKYRHNLKLSENILVIE